MQMIWRRVGYLLKKSLVMTQCPVLGGGIAPSSGSKFLAALPALLPAFLPAAFCTPRKAGDSAGL